ncbi:MAG: hypothetical protein ACFFDO_09085 [Candidatus Thorarchaeota archaeon]
MTKIILDIRKKGKKYPNLIQNVNLAPKGAGVEVDVNHRLKKFIANYHTPIAFLEKE